MRRHLVIIGMGYSASRVAAQAIAQSWDVTGTKRVPDGQPNVIAYADAAEAIKSATHLLISAPPENGADPAIRDYGRVISAARHLTWIGYYSTTGVYGDRQGGAVDETTPVNPTQPRAQARVTAEDGWARIAADQNIAFDRIRIGGIYGPGRSPFDMLRSDRPRLVIAPDHAFSRIHRDDIAGGTMAAMETASGERVLNFVDTTPSPQHVVIEEAARIAQWPLPTPTPLDQALREMNPMARSFWSERRIVRSELTCQLINRAWKFPSYREGLADIWAQMRSA
ncbi:SDR family NAD(P)-dependent oxidoreductase [Candidatus Kirkpatrickella diaphorinae]|uniref:SDR family NAD(P)-dependent oxidoreductase n=1 Tax=Candidatus Kirkpatrickella diaphorinae TaxID=2984322 RepID=A0ABY6GKD3_9PROT|nr:SDR family NAD(P)-dependent oxidoreductase [Candidatus Kirkpatrickella diaphorinae]UYH51106.1 SDR family NAD(P)-dependent oxidoreductase [Candidatus Kirkpatrickella diaphorinae]